MSKKSAHKNSWKAAESHRKVKQKTKLAFLVLGLIVLFFLVGKGIEVFKITRQYTWDGSTNINLVFKSGQVSVLSFNPQQNSITIVKIPEETYINVPGGYGSWPLRSVYGLGQSEEVPKGSELLIASLRSFLGVPFDGFIEYSGQPEEFVSSTRNPLNLTSIWGNSKTNLAPFEFIKLTLALRGVRFDKVNSYDLGALDLLQRSTLADGGQVFIADNIKIDSFSQKLIEDKMGTERIGVALFNVTKVPGLAQKASRVIENIGGNAIISTNGDGEFKTSRVVVNPENVEVKDSYTYKRLVQIFGSDCSSEPKCDKIPLEVMESRAQINIILGEDFYQKY